MNDDERQGRSTYRFLGSAPTGTSRSTNRVPRLPLELGSGFSSTEADPQRQRSIFKGT